MAAGWIPWLDLVFQTAAGTAPNALGTLETYVAGTSTPAPTYSDSDLTVANPVILDLDASGRPEVDVFMPAHGVKFILKDALGAVIWTRDDISDPGQIFAATYGTLQTDGSLNVATGYTVTADDRLVTMGTAGGNILLPAASDFAASITLKNMSTTTAMTVTPNGSDTIDGIAALYSVAASTSPLFKTITLISNGVDAWWIQSSHGLS